MRVEQGKTKTERQYTGSSPTIKLNEVYGGKYPVKMKLEISKIVLKNLQVYYTELLADYPDVLTTQAVSEITGYGKTSI